MINKHFELSSLFTVDKAANKDDDEDLVIKGTANATTKDRMGDVIVTEAWTKGGLDNYAKNPIILAFHNHSKPIGQALEIKANNDGLHVSAKISKAAGEVFQLIKDGVLKAFSVGFIVKDATYDPKTDIFKILDLELLEISVVSVPANQDSLFSLSKSFDNEEEYIEFKKSFIKTVSETPEAKIEKSSKSESDEEKNKEFNMDPKEIEKMIQDAAERAAAQAAAASVKAAEEAAASAAKEAESIARIETLRTGTEQLLADITKRFEETEGSLTKAVDELRAEVKEKSDELLALQTSKMKFEDKKGADDGISYKEKELAVLLAKATGKGLTETKAWNNIVQKYGDHVPSADWEDRVSTNMHDEIRQRLVLAPIFNQITMPGPIVKFPVNPEAGYATWVVSGFKSVTSSGTEATHALKEISISAYKLATKEFIGNEEEDDAIIALLPIVRDAMVRRTAKSVDKALLRGAAAGADPLKGLTLYQTSTANVTVTTTAKVTVSNLTTLRRNLGTWGLDPNDVVYLVSQDVYYDLLEDTNFMTMDKVGAKATILTGQIGFANGSPVIVSGEFAAKAGGTAGSIGAVAVNPRNFFIGNYKGLRVESDYLVEEQMRLLVATLRMGFQQISTVDGQAVSALRWT